MYRFYLLYCLFLCLGNILFAQTTGFEKGVPQSFCTVQSNELSSSEEFYKEGKRSLAWQFSPRSVLTVKLDTPLHLDSISKEKRGITLWIYNEQARKDSLRFEFFSPTGHVSYRFGFRLNAQGWRACWIGFAHMKGDKQENTIAGYRIVAPDNNGRVFFDRLVFPVKEMNQRTTPDMQMPYNNSLTFRDLWHWCRVWQWEQLEYDLPLPATLTPTERQELQTIEERLTKVLTADKVSQGKIDKAYATFQKAQIQRSGNGFTGAPLVVPDDKLNRKKGEISLNDLETMLSGFAYDAYYNQSKDAEHKYFLVWDYAMNQGFAFGSGMGTNHHYGYQIRKIYTTAWLMRDKIRQAPTCDNILSTLSFWAALQETRKACGKNRDELLDTWHTLLMPKIVSAMMTKDERERVRALKGLSRWVSTSLRYTPGTIGGIKVDGTTFHHGGFYPAYTTGALAMLGQFTNLTNKTSYQLTLSARKVLKSALIAMRNYCNKYEWGVGISGRHPFGGSMKDDDIDAFAYLALSGDFSDKGEPFDHQLAADYLRLCKRNTPEAAYFKQQGILPATAPQGFFVYNYGSAGIFRRNNWMVTLKGYNTDVWGAEIYTKDNRYGRYQSYGSVQIMGAPSRKASGYNENGWDWNRLPGTTTIHLPFELLNSPLPGTTMARSKEKFAGASSLKNQNGMFAMKLMERDLKNFTGDFVARKSVFCFDNRLICLGTDIKNSNSDYPTETTLFQHVFRPGKDFIRITGEKKQQIGLQQELPASDTQPVCLEDGCGNLYFVKDGKVKVQITEQESRHEKLRTPTTGTFASAWIAHGTAPKDGSYEYMVWIQPSGKELKTHVPAATYKVIQRDRKMHAVNDVLTGTMAYAVFEDTKPAADNVFSFLPAETMVMYQKENNALVMSVCTPNLNIAEKTFTTKEPSRIIIKELELKGKWHVSAYDKRVKTTYRTGTTQLSVECQHGQPVEFTLIQ